MEEWQERVIHEKRGIDYRLDKLKAFLGTHRFLGLDEAEQNRMIRQAEVMTEYSKILAERIDAF